MFDDLTNLELLYLNNNDLSELPDGVFEGVANLQYLRLYENDLSELPDSVFDGLSNLGTLHLARNALTALPDGVFEGLSSLEYLSLAGNPGLLILTVELERYIIIVPGLAKRGMFTFTWSSYVPSPAEMIIIGATFAFV